ncbi:MAG: NAD(+) diphosphatase [Lachnospiraceae bacterium]|nr:NAD(+) diphosphatase [Lachnospiraceae bacterium]
MIQDIFPSKLDNHYTDAEAAEQDFVLRMDGDGRLLVKITDAQITFPTGAQIPRDGAAYLFDVDGQKYFLENGKSGAADGSADAGASEAEASAGGVLSGYEFKSLRELRDSCVGKELLIAFTAYHLWKWYRDSRFCGRCGAATEHDSKERAMRCPACGNVIYPRINPAVIVGVIKGDSILITRYRTGFGHNALVAGFTEIGETLEETVAREVMEETGVRVKNIRYYKSQPWGMAQDILTGFYCEADGDAQIQMDANELRYAEWVKREDVVLQPNNLSLTNEMMRMFRDGKIGGTT